MTDRTTEERIALLKQLRSVLADKTNQATADRVDLRDAVCRYVALEQSRGLPLADVVVTVKDILRKAERGAVEATDKLAQQLVDWCVEFHRLGALLALKNAVPGS